MKSKIIITGVISALVGIAGGFLAAISLFAVNVDLLGLPYKNTPVSLKETIELSQGANKIIVPAGSKLLYGYTAKEQPYYLIEVYGHLFGDRDLFENEEQREVFFISTELGSNGR